MTTLFYAGRNLRNVSGLSWKIWKIERCGKVVEAHWGQATLNNRRFVPAYTLQRKRWQLTSVWEAKADYERRIAEKLGKGYGPLPEPE